MLQSRQAAQAVIESANVDEDEGVGDDDGVEEALDLADEERDTLPHLEETRAKRAARKSVVMGRAPNLSNIAEMSEFPSNAAADPSRSTLGSRGPTPVVGTSPRSWVESTQPRSNRGTPQTKSRD